MKHFLSTVFVILFFVITTTATGNSTACGTTGSRCIGSSGYCSGSYSIGTSCVDGYCRCANNPERDYCTCLAISGQCHIQRGSTSSAVGTPTFNGNSQTTYSCVANENCNYDVHVISNYEGDYNHGFGPVTRSGNTNVRINVRGQVHRPLVLVFVSYEPVNWILSVSSGVTIERVLLGSYYLDNSRVTYSSGTVQSLERHSYSTLPCGYGSDTGGCHTDEILEYVVGRFGPVSSFSGSYRADRWTLNIQQDNTPSGVHCSGVVTPPTIASQSEPTPTTQSPSDDVCASTGTRCSFGSYCSSGYTFTSRCIDDYCRCPNTPGRDYCTCFAISGQCRIQQDLSSAVGTPTFNGNSQTTYSCVANENCNYDVHVISNYEGDYNHGFGSVTRSGNTNVRVNVRGQVHRPLVLVFVSYEPVNWILSVSSGVTIEKVLLGSYYLDNSDVTYSSGTVRSLEKYSYSTLPCGYGDDAGGCRTGAQLEYVVGRFGPVSSFSGSYRADRWTLNIQQQEEYHVATSSVSSVVPTAVSTTPNPFPSGLSRECRIQQGSQPAVGTPTFDGASQSTYSCFADAQNCNYDVHVISNYEGDYNHGFGPVTRSGNTNVRINVRGQVHRPLVLVFVSYEPVNWILSISSEVTIERVLLGSYYLDHSDVTYSSGTVRSLERVPRSNLPYGYGSDTGGGSTDELLEYVVGRFGPVSSFSGSYRADRWTLNIVQQQNYTGSDCSSQTDPQSSSSSFTTISTIIGSLFASVLFLILLLGVLLLIVACVMRTRTVEREKTAYNEFDDPRGYIGGSSFTPKVIGSPVDVNPPVVAIVSTN